MPVSVVRANLEPPTRPATARHSLSPRSHPRFPTVSLAGYLPLLRQIEVKAGNRGYHVPDPAGPTGYLTSPLAPAYSPMALATCPKPYGNNQQLRLCVLNEDSTTVHLHCACGTCVAVTLHGCRQCRSLPGRPSEPPIGMGTLSPRLRARPLPVTHVL